MSWNRTFLPTRGIRDICRKKILDDVLLPLKLRYQWNILIVDSMALDLISTCFKTEEILSCNIAVILNLDEERENIGYLSSIYMLCPTEESVNHLLKDFGSRSKYEKVHLVFLSAVPAGIFETLFHELKSEWIETFVEIDLMFLPHESRVYSLNDPSFFSNFFDAYNDIKIKEYEIAAKKLVTLFSTIGIRPLIRYRRGFAKNLIFAQLVEKELLHQSTLAEKDFQERISADENCVLLILDRSFDCITPVLHDVTFQAMMYDLLDIQDDLYLYSTGLERTEDEMQFVSLTEDDQLWCLLRHEPISTVSMVLRNLVQNDELMTVAQKIGSRHRGLPSLGKAMKAHLHYKKNESFYGFRHIAQECQQKYCEGINVLAQLELNLALGKDSRSNLIKDALPEVLNIVTSQTYSFVEKLRIILLYVFFKKGLNRNDLDRLFQKASIPSSLACTIMNFLHMDLDVVRPGFCEPTDSSLKQVQGCLEDTQYSCWTPLVKNLLLRCVEDKLGEDLYPFLNPSQIDQLIPKKNSRAKQWTSDEPNESCKRHLVLFIAGGVSYSEMRCVYEVMAKNPQWEIYIGGDSLITPTTFFEKMKELHSFFNPNN